MNKKAFEMQFNWIFVLVAGAAILLFFTVIVVKQRSMSETSTKATVLKSIEAIVVGASVSTDTTSKIDIPNSDIEVSCNKISLGAISKQYQNLILFAPSLIKGDKLIAQTLAFNAPYRATNLLYITSPMVRYILIGDTELAKEINKSLPSDLKKEFYLTIPTNIKNENDYKVKFIFFGVVDSNVLNKFTKMPDSDVTAVRVDGDNEKGEVEFYQKKKSPLSWESTGKSYYLTKSSLLGAIYSDAKETYECNIRNAFLRLELVSAIYTNRTVILKDSVTSALCKGYYDTAWTQLGEIGRTSSSLSKSSNLAKADIDKIASAAQSLAYENKRLQINSCPLIY